MSKITLVYAVIASLALLGCASVKRDQSSGAEPMAGGSCNAHECHVIVTVADCKISVDPDPIAIFARNVEIHWDLRDSPGYTFTEDGIVIPANKGDFTDPRRIPTGLKFLWHDKNTTAATYKYTVNVTLGAARCPSLDPQIVNH